MIQNQQMLVDSRKNKNIINNTETDSQSSLDGTNLLKSESVVNPEKRKSIYFQRRNTCAVSHTLNKFGFQANNIKNLVTNKNLDSETQTIVEDKEKDDIDTMTSFNKDLKIASNSDHQSKEQTSNQIIEEQSESIQLQVINKPIYQSKKLSKNASINITEQAEESEDYFSSSQPNFHIAGKSSGSIKSNNDIKSQQGDKIIKKLPDIEEEEISSPMVKKEKIQIIIHKNSEIQEIRESLLNQKSASNLDKKDLSFEYKNQNASWYSAGSILGKTKLSDSDENLRDKINSNLAQTCSGIFKSSYKEENSKENESYCEEEKSTQPKVNDLKIKPSSSKQLNLITQNSDESISLNSIQLQLSCNNRQVQFFDHFSNDESENILKEILHQTKQDEELNKQLQKYLNDKNENCEKLIFLNEEQQKVLEGVFQKLSNEHKNKLLNLLPIISNQASGEKNSINWLQNMSMDKSLNCCNEETISLNKAHDHNSIHQVLSCLKNKQNFNSNHHQKGDEEKGMNNHFLSRLHVHFPDIPLQTIQEQKIENENQDGSCKQTQNNDVQSNGFLNEETEQIKQFNYGFGYHDFSVTSLSSSLSEVDLMVADFFKKIQIKNEKERNFIQQIEKDSKNSSDANFLGSQWVFSQEFSPKGNKFWQQHSCFQETLNFIDSNLISNQIQQKHQHIENQFIGDKDSIQQTNTYSQNEKIQTKDQNECNIEIKNQTLANIENKEQSNIDQTYSESINLISLNQNVMNHAVQDKNQQESTQVLQDKAKKIALQRLVSIDCSSQNSSNSNFSNQLSNKQVESQSICLSKKSIKNSHSNIQSSNQQKSNGEKSPETPLRPPNLFQSRKSIRMNTIDIVTNELNDCFHTSSQSIKENFLCNDIMQLSDEKSGNYKNKEKNGSSSPRSPSGSQGNSSFSQAQGLMRQTSMSKSSQQKSIFGQKFCRLKSESLNQSDDDMTQSEYVDQVPDLSTQVLIKFRHNQKKQYLQSQENNDENQIDYDESDFQQITDQAHQQINTEIGNTQSDNAQKSQQSSDKSNKNNKKNSISLIKLKKTQINNYLEGDHKSEEKLEAEDVSYISKSSSSSSSEPSSSQYDSSSSSNNDSFSDNDSPTNQKKSKISKTPQTNRRQLQIKKQIKSQKKESIIDNSLKAKELNSPLTPIPQRSLMRRSSLPLHLIMDLRNNGSKSEIQKDIVQLSTNFEIKIKQHEKYQCQTKLRITDLVQSLGKIFIVQDFKSTAQQKMQCLTENEKRIEFLLKKLSLCTFKNKVQEIVKLFNERYKLIQQIEQVEKAILTTIYHEKKKETGEQSDHSVDDSEPKSPKIIQNKRRLARSGTFNGAKHNNLKISLDHRTSIDSILQHKFNHPPTFENKETKQIINEITSQEDHQDSSTSPSRKRSSDLIKNRKIKTPQQGITERRSSHHRINFDNMLSLQIEKEEDQKIEILDEILYKNCGYSSDGILDNPYSSCAHKEKPDKETEKNSVGIKDFDFLKLISKGAFGRVWLVKKKNTEDIYAMKIVNFAEKMNKNHLDSLKKENEILSKVQGDYVVKAVYTFTHESYICFVMEYMIGGDLGSIISTYGVLEESVAKFYIAEIVLAIYNLHQIGIIHRDLKPDNLLLDSQGHLKLTDFGLSDMGLQRRNKTASERKKEKLKIFNNLQKNNKVFQKFDDRINQNDKIDKQKKPIRQEILEMKKNVDSLNILRLNNKKSKPANRIIGTPDYIAPEILNGEGLQNPAIDWWSVGVMLFELLIGIPPFNDDSVEKIFDNIKNYRIAWDQIPVGDGEDEVSQKSVNLIKKLMHPDPKQRLGSQGILQIQSDPFFVGIDWSNLKKMPAPIIPEVKNIFDTSNFDKDKVYQEGEQIDPFFGLPKGIETVNEAKKLLDKTGFSVKRYDVLFEENQKHIEKEEIQIQKMVKQLQEQEKEIEKLENECGADDSSDETNFHEIDNILSRKKTLSNSSCITKSSSSCHKKNSTDFSPFLESTISKIKAFEPL